MSASSAVRLTRRMVDSLSTEKRDALFWDRDLPGFGVRVYRTGRKVYVVQARGPAGKTRRAVVGGHREIGPGAARRQAATMIDRIKQGEDPVPAAPTPELTVADLAARYLSAHATANCRPNTVRFYRNIVEYHVVPELGSLPVSAVERSHVAALHHGMRDKPHQANHTVNLLARMFRLTEAWDLTAPRSNPCERIRRYKTHRRERFLTPEEYRRLGVVLDEAEADGSTVPSAIAAIRLLLLTGCRKNEIVTLRWDDIDRTAGEVRLRDTKTGIRRVPLTPAIDSVLAGIPRIESNPWVITGKKPGRHLAGIEGIWMRLRARAGLQDVRLHDCRHSYASRALALGEGLPMIGKLLGHRKVKTTMRYAHLARETEKAAAEKVGGSIGADILASEADVA